MMTPLSYSTGHKIPNAVASLNAEKTCSMHQLYIVWCVNPVRLCRQAYQLGAVLGMARDQS